MKHYKTYSYESEPINRAKALNDKNVVDFMLADVPTPSQSMSYIEAVIKTWKAKKED